MTDTKVETKPEIPFMNSSEIFMAMVKPFLDPFLGREPAKPPVNTASQSSAAPKPQELLPPPKDNVTLIDEATDRFRHWGNNRIDKIVTITSHKVARIMRIRLSDPYARPEINFITEREVDEFIDLIKAAKDRAFGRR